MSPRPRSPPLPQSSDIKPITALYSLSEHLVCSNHRTPSEFTYYCLLVSLGQIHILFTTIYTARDWYILDTEDLSNE